MQIFSLNLSTIEMSIYFYSCIRPNNIHVAGWLYCDFEALFRKI